MQLRNCQRHVLLTVCDVHSDRVVYGIVSARMRLMNLLDAVKKHLNIVGDFTLERDGEHFKPKNTALLGTLFDCEQTPNLNTTSFSLLPSSSIDWKRIPLKNRLKARHSGQEVIPIQQSPLELANENNSETIGLRELMDEDNSTVSPSKCLAIIPVATEEKLSDSCDGSTHCETDSVVRDTKGNGFAGLVNSGMTCYMNSLLQTLYMTPEFRNALYCWRFQGTAAESVLSIPYQLQKLFVQLYATTETAVSTVGVTTSFGWRSSDIFQQQDIHELCRVMFDALEKKLGTGGSQEAVDLPLSFGYSSMHPPTHDLINRLYQGQRSDCVRCTGCDRVSCRPDTFLDIQVPLRPFDLNAEPYDSLETAFRALIKPEQLDGSNQYYCSRCRTKRDAERIAAFHRMPYLLTLQLMRFTFDLTTMNRIKINDRFTFPLDTWDLSEFITPPPQDHSSDDDAESVDECVTEDGTDYLETENEYDVNSVCASSNSRCTADRTVNRVEDEFEEMDLGAGDSGVNSSTNESPYDAGFSGSPSTHSPSHMEQMRDCCELNAANQTLTSNMPTGLAFERAVASAVRNHVNMKEINTDNVGDSEEDDGFGTGDARSACSSTTTSSAHAHRPVVDGGMKFQSCRSRTKCKTSSDIVPGTDEPTPTKDRKPSAHDQQQPSTVYELFSVMVHSGFINGGHYYAYIKSFSDKQWYCFNDKTVSRATRSDLEETFGSNQSYTSRANAYFLMYRRIDPTVNEDFFTPDDFPAHISDMIEAVRREEAEAQRKHELELSLCKFEAYTSCPSTQRTIQAVVSLYKDQTMAEAANIVRQTLLPDCTSLNSPDCRLVQYTSTLDCFGKSPEYSLRHRSEGATESTSESTDQTQTYSMSSNIHARQPNSVFTDAANLVTVGEFAEQKRLYPFKLWLEHRMNVPGALSACAPRFVVPQKVYEPKGLTIHVSRVDVGRRFVFSSFKLWFSLSSTIEQLLSEVWQILTGSDVKLSPPGDANSTSSLRYAPGFHLISDQSCRGKRTSWIEKGLPEWVFVLSDHIDATTKLSSLFTESVADLSNSFNYRRTETPRVYVDLGPGFDDVFGDSSTDSNNPSSIVDRDAKRGRWQSGPLELLDIEEDHCRLKKLVDVVDEHLFVVELSLQYPARSDIDLAILQWRLIYSDDLPMDVDEHPNDNDDQIMLDNCDRNFLDCYEITMNKSLDFGEQGHRLSVANSNISSTDSGCSVAVNYGSPRRTPSPIDALRCRRRTNSQSQLDQLRTDDKRLQRRSLSSSFTGLPQLTKNTALESDDSLLPTCRRSHNPVTIENNCSTQQSPSSRMCIFKSASSNCASTSVNSSSILVRLDKRLSVEQFKKNAAHYLNLSLDQVNIEVFVNDRSLCDNFRQVDPTDSLRLSIDCAVSTDVKKISLRVLDLVGLRHDSATAANDRLSPVWDDRIVLYCRSSWSVQRILASVATLLRTVWHIDISLSRLRLRKCGSSEPTPGPILDPRDILCSFYTTYQGLMVQLMPEVDSNALELQAYIANDATPSSSKPNSPTLLGSIFVRRWYPSTRSFEPAFHELTLPSSIDRPARWDFLVSWISQHSGLPADRISMARCNFPGVSHLWGMDASSSNGATVSWYSTMNYSPLLSPVPNNGQVVYYKDCSETCLELSAQNTVDLQSQTITDTPQANSPPTSNDAQLSYGPNLPTSSSCTNMCTLGSQRSTYEQPLRIYTAEDALPSILSPVPPVLRPPLQGSRTRESRTP